MEKQILLSGLVGGLIGGGVAYFATRGSGGLDNARIAALEQQV